MEVTAPRPLSPHKYTNNLNLWYHVIIVMWVQFVESITADLPENCLFWNNFWRPISPKINEYTAIFFLLINLRYFKGLQTNFEKKLTAAKFSMNVQSWVKICRFFSKKSKNFNFSKKFFWQVPSTPEGLQNLLKQLLCAINYLASRTKTRFFHIQGAEKGVPPLSTPRGHWGRNFFRHKLGLGWTFKMRLELVESFFHDGPTLLWFLPQTLLSRSFYKSLPICVILHCQNDSLYYSVSNVMYSIVMVYKLSKLHRSQSIDYSIL